MPSLTSDNKKAFRFYTRMHLSALTGLKAATLDELLTLLKEVPGACIYHHTHRFLQQHQYLSPEPPNDFAYWVTEILGEKELGERLASIDTVQFTTIRALRDKIVAMIEEYLEYNPTARKRFARKEEEFHFIRSMSFVIPTKYTAVNLQEFANVLEKITIDSIYFHMFEARLRLGKEKNDFSLWLETAQGQLDLARKIERLDPYTQTLEDLRKTIIQIIKKVA